MLMNLKVNIHLYELGSPFCWSSVKIGWYTAGTYFWEYIVGIFIFKALLLFFTDVKISFFGYVSYIISLVIFGFSTSDWMIYLGMPCNEENHKINQKYVPCADEYIMLRTNHEHIF
jgi:hypothetical protein